MTTNLVEVESAGRHWILRLNRPEVRNALNGELVQALREALARAADPPEVRCVVLAGVGKDFCAGADLKVLQQIATRTPAENREDSRHLAAVFEAIHTHPKPVIAAVHGNALAGGCGLACVCDLVIAEETSRFGFTESRIGFVAAIVARFLIDRVGPSVARELLLSGRRFDAPEALRIGLVNATSAPGQVLETALARADELARSAASSLRLTKQLLAELPGRPLSEALEFACRLNAETRATPDCKEGIQAFLEKRKPRWMLEEDTR